ncbi:SixA phosphatase family protein [Aquimarina rhabdastrellae]
MKYLYLIRHAKSSWKFDVIDHERPLSSRGINDAGLIAKELHKYIKQVDQIWCSDAKRTQETAALIFEDFKIDKTIFELKHNLYDFQGKQVLDEIHNCPDEITHLMVFGHNHAFTSIANMYGDQLLDNVPTTGVVGIRFEQDSWKNINAGHTLFTLFPKTLR